VPGRLIEHNEAVRARRDDLGDLVEVMLHRRAVGVRHNDRRTGTPLGADRTE
jgi:hypothetical protein